jgi:iron complex outermembrane receptor protein
MAVVFFARRPGIKANYKLAAQFKHKGYKMRVDEDRAILARLLSPFAIVFTSLCLLAAPTVFAQDDDSMDSLDDLAELEDDDGVEEVVVTGSRLKRDTYSSISPLQVITGQVSREIGLIDPGTILQESTAASGVQVDLTFQGFVLDNGPGATTIDLRGLGAGRTLLLINGRRVAPAGVEGAPVSPDTTLLPGSLVQQYDVLLDGASSVYGSDAVSGVVNVVLRKDFDGLELEAFTSVPAAGDSEGLQTRIAASWGKNYDRGFIGGGAEFREWDPVTLDDREWTRGCNEHLEISRDGQILREGIYYNYFYEMRPDKCKASATAGRMQEFGAGFGSIYYTPGESNVGIPNFSENSMFSLPVSYGADGYNRVSWVDWSTNGKDGFTHMIPEIKTYSAMAYGEYTISGEANLTPYFEVMYSQRDSFQNEGAYQLFPYVPANNPFSPCNPAAAGGVDCGDAWDSVLRSPEYAARFAAAYGATPQEYYDNGWGNFFNNPEGDAPIGALLMRPIVNVKGDRTLTDVTASQQRIVLGLRGDMPFMNFGTIDDWAFDFYAMQSDSEGDSSRPGIRGDRLDHALGWNSANGDMPCVDDFDQGLSSDVTSGCVPINMWASTLYDPVIGGDFGTAAERDYVFDTRDFTTKYRQTIFSAYANGEVFDLPGGQALFGLGIEYREDEINSIPDDVARDGLFFGFFSDGGAVGEKWTKEYFAELELPFLADVKAFKELTANISTRHTEDEYYGKAWTYSGKLAWRPVDSLLLRGTVGTSYRAPNMRENFLLGQTGFLNLFDPCVVPLDAVDELTDEYDPALDKREDKVLANCLANGVDPTTFRNGGSSIYSTEVSAGGAVDVREETSESMSAGLTWEQPFFQAFDMIIGATYYEIDIRDEIIEPSAQFIINDCYNDDQGDSVFCSRIDRGPSLAMDIIDRGFINRDNKKARGVDLNMTLDYPTEMFGRAVDLQADFAFNRTLEIKDIFIGDDGVATIDDDVGEFAYPEWKGRMSFRADVNDWRITWSTRYVSSFAEDPDFIDDWGGVADSNSDTCLGEINGGIDCRNIGFAENYFVHDASVYYYGDKWTLGAGMRNILNTEPPEVDSSPVFAFRNVPYGSGYDVFGRTLFLNAVFRWQ